MADATKIYGWDDPVEDQGSNFGKLPDGDYHFVVTAFEKDFDEQTECPLAKVSLWLEKDGLVSTVREFLPLNDALMWKIVALFTSVELRKHGDVAPLPWDDLVGSIGYASIKANPKKPQYNQIGKYLTIPEDVPIPEWATKKAAAVKGGGSEDVPAPADEDDAPF